MKFKKYKDAKTAANRVMKSLSKYRKWNWVATVRHPQPSIFLPAAKHWSIFINGQITTQQYTAKILITAAQHKNAYAVHTTIKWDELPGRWSALVGRYDTVFVEKRLPIGLEAAECWLENRIKRYHAHAQQHELQELKEGTSTEKIKKFRTLFEKMVKQVW